MTGNQNENNSFVETMSQQKKAYDSNQEVIPGYVFYPSAENTLNKIAKIILIISILGCVVFLIGAIAAFSDYDPEIGWSFLGISITVLLSGIASWAIMKVIINISRNLFMINSVLHHRKQ